MSGDGLLGLPIIIDPTKPAGRQIREALSTQVKLPTASRSKGLGTGEVDYTVGATLSKHMGAVTPFIALGYSLPGDPAGFDLRNSLYGRVGASVQMNPSIRGSLNYGYAESASPLIADDQQIATSLNASLSRRVSLGVYGNAGLSDGAPDIGLGIQVGLRM